MGRTGTRHAASHARHAAGFTLGRSGVSRVGPPIRPTCGGRAAPGVLGKILPQPDASWTRSGGLDLALASRVTVRRSGRAREGLRVVRHPEDCAVGVPSLESPGERAGVRACGCLVERSGTASGRGPGLDDESARRGGRSLAEPWSRFFPRCAVSGRTRGRMSGCAVARRARTDPAQVRGCWPSLGEASGGAVSGRARTERSHTRGSGPRTSEQVGRAWRAQGLSGAQPTSSA